MTNFSGLNQNNLRKTLFLIFFGSKYGDKSDDFSFEKYKYIIPMQNQFDNPIGLDSNDTFLMYWIEEDESLHRDNYEGNENVSRCVADILLRFCGKNAENWAKSFRHHCRRSDIYSIWSGVCNADRFDWVSPIIPHRISFFGNNNEICYDIRIRIYYKETIPTNWSPLEGLDIGIDGRIITEEGEDA